MIGGSRGQARESNNYEFDLKAHDYSQSKLMHFLQEREYSKLLLGGDRISHIINQQLINPRVTLDDGNIIHIRKATREHHVDHRRHLHTRRGCEGITCNRDFLIVSLQESSKRDGTLVMKKVSRTCVADDAAEPKVLQGEGFTRRRDGDAGSPDRVLENEFGLNDDRGAVGCDTRESYFRSVECAERVVGEGLIGTNGVSKDSADCNIIVLYKLPVLKNYLC